MPADSVLEFFVLTAKAQYSLANAETYFREHLSTGDYYTEGKHVAGEWFGIGAEQLNLHGNVKLDDFVKLCRNKNLDSDERLTQRSKKNRRVFYDFTLSPPKSVSIVALVAGDKRVEKAHENATIFALRELEKFSAARVRKNGASAYRNTSNIVAAIFRHDTSRALDPHLHCHCIIFNATHDRVEGRWKALETYEMLQAAKFAENIYYHELAQELRRLGYEFENNRRGDFEVKGISSELVERFSKRHKEIDAKTQEFLEREPQKQNQNLKDIREHIAHKERSRKIKDVGRNRLEELWEKQISVKEKAAFSQLKQTNSSKFTTTEPAARATTWAEEHLFDRRSVVNEYQLWRYALEHGRGENFSLKDLQLLTARKPYVRNEMLPGKVTTRETLEREQKIVLAAQTGCNCYKRFNAKPRIQNTLLDFEQRAAVQQILSSRDFITLFRGGAGTGKSFALKEVRSGLLQAGHSVHVIAPQRQQVLDLQNDLGGDGATVSEFLAKRKMDTGAVVIVDEAGQIGAKQMLQLFELVRSQKGRLILSGDTRQHGPVEASDALRVIEKYGGLNAAELTAIRRQNPDLAKTRKERKSIEDYRAAVNEARNGKLRASFDRLNGTGAIEQCGISEQQKSLVEKYLALKAEGHSTVVVSQTWSEIHKVNEQIRAGLKLRNLVGPTDVIVNSLERIDLTDAQKRDKRFYSENSVLILNQSTSGFQKGAQGHLLEIGDRHLLVEADGKIRPVPFKHLERISVCQPKEIALAPGDCIQLKANGKTKGGKHLANGEIVTVKQLNERGEIELEDGRMLSQTYRQFGRGYAVTSYAAQGKTADFVIFSDSSIRAATNRKQWYVTISRGRKGIKIFTSDKHQLRENVIRQGNRELALELATKEPGFREQISSSAPKISPNRMKL